MSTTTPTKEGELTSPFNNTNYNVAPDIFEGVIAQLPADQQDPLRFWYFLGKERGWSLNKLARVCGVSSTTLSRVFRGDYGADTSKLCANLAKARDSFGQAVENPDFIMTSMAKQMFRLFDRARALRTVQFMSGAMGTGKTTVAMEYKRLNNHGRTIYYRCEPGLTFVQFVAELARAHGISAKKQTHLRLREKLYTVLAAGNRLCIIDEFHQLFLRRERNDITPVLQCEFIRAAHDISGAGFGIISTDALEKHLIDNANALAQLMDRNSAGRARLPDKPTKGDVAAFIRSYGLPELTDREPEAQVIVRDILAASGLRKLTLHLRDGKAVSVKAGKPYAWSHFVTAFEDIASLSKPSKQ
jgi:DNA transposition AAA+ family ATPase